MAEAGLLENFEEIGERAYLLDCEGLDGEEAENDEDGEGVEVISQEAGQFDQHLLEETPRILGEVRCFDATDEGVERDTDRKKEGCRDDMHSGPGIRQPSFRCSIARIQDRLHGRDDSRSTQQHVCASKQVVQQAKYHVNDVGDVSCKG